MPSYLFLWNPAKDTHSFENFAQVIADARSGRPYETNWVCQSRRPLLGDIAYMQRTGLRHNGVFARGVVTEGAHLADDGVQIVRLSLGEFLPMGSELARDQIIEFAKYDAPWTPQASGNVIPQPILTAIEALWLSPVPSGEPRHADSETAAEAEDLVGLEGESRFRMIRHRYRERRLRDSKIAEVLARTGSLTCEVPGCNFDFAAEYGSLGVGYAQVHHLNPLAERDSEQPTTLFDLVIVCANCHAMIHRGGECRDLGSIRVSSKCSSG